jgi:ribosomal protein S18 acetylase RimI-like enzyme
MGFALSLLITYADFTYGDINEIFVAERFRRKGIGAMLIKKTINELKRRGAKAIIISTDNENEAAKKLYSKLGFKRDYSSYAIRFNKH